MQQGLSPPHCLEWTLKGLALVDSAPCLLQRMWEVLEGTPGILSYYIDMGQGTVEVEKDFLLLILFQSF